MKQPDHLTDVELVEHLELVGPRLRLAGVDELRQVADVAAGLALEAAARLRDVLELEMAGTGPRPPAPGPLLGKVRNVTLHADGRLTADLEVNDAGAKFVEQITRGRA